MMRLKCRMGTAVSASGASPCSGSVHTGSSFVEPDTHTVGCNEEHGLVNSGSTHPNSGGEGIIDWSSSSRLAIAWRCRHFWGASGGSGSVGRQRN